MQLIDIHTHLNMLKETPEEILEKASQAGVDRVITIGTEPGDHSVVLDLAKKFHPQVHCTLGVHPHEAKKYSDECEKFIEDHLSQPEVVAVGEIGLDYFYEYSDREVQKEVFRKQMSLAEKHKMPVQVHTREAENDTDMIVNEFRGRVRGVFHCFTSSLDLAKKGLDAGWNISFSGIVTFKNAAELRKTVEYVPLDRLHVETDAPYLTPAPHRGKPNEPARVIHTAELVAELKGISLQELCEQTKKNALTLFPKLSWS